MITQLFPKKNLLNKIQVWFKSQIANIKAYLIYKLGGKPQDEVDKALNALRNTQQQAIQQGINSFINQHGEILERIINPYLHNSPSKDVIIFTCEIDNYILRNLHGPHEVDLIWELVLRTLNHEFKRVGLAGLSNKGWQRQEYGRRYESF